MKAQNTELNLCFRLRLPQALVGKELMATNSPDDSPESLQQAVEQAFESREERIFVVTAKKFYNPTIELIESKLRKHSEFRASLIIPPSWLEWAEKYYEVLVTRVRGVVLSGRVDLIYQLPVRLPLDTRREALLALAKKVKLDQDHYWKVLGTKCRAVCVEELDYADKFAGLMEKFGFEVILLRKRQVLDEYQDPNQLYLPATCKQLLAVVQNDELVERLGKRSRFESTDGSLLTPTEFLKELQVEGLKGHSISLVLDAEKMQLSDIVEDGMLAFLKELIDLWLGSGLRRFTAMSRIADHGVPVGEIVQDIEFDPQKEMARIAEYLQEKRADEAKKAKPVVSMNAGRSDEKLPQVEKVLPEVSVSKMEIPKPAADEVAIVFGKKQQAVGASDDNVVTVKRVKKETNVVRRTPVEKSAVQTRRMPKPLPVDQPEKIAVSVVKPPKMPRPVKAPGHLLDEKRQKEPIPQSKEQLQSSVHEAVDFEELWKFDESAVQEDVQLKKTKLPGIGEVKQKFQSLEVTPSNDGDDIGKIDYDLSDDVSDTGEVVFKVMEVNGFGEIYEKNQENG